MRAVVMAGGEGTRLRPMTANQPKPLLPVVNRPIMEHVLRLLRRHGVTETVVTVHFLASLVHQYFGDGAELGLSVTYATDEMPLGTAGSVKGAEGALRGEPFIVVSGDALTDADLSALIAFHRAQGAMVTVALKRVPDPVDFGIVITDDSAGIQRFLEKPTWGQVFSDTVNTGIYVMEPEVLSLVPAAQPVDWAVDVFPRLLESGAPLLGWLLEDYWQDVGTLDSYLRAQADVLNGHVRVDIDGFEVSPGVWLGEGAEIDSEATLTGPVYVGRHCTVEAGAELREYTVLGDNVVVKHDAFLHRAVVHSNCFVGPQTRLRGCVLGANTAVLRAVNIEEGVVVGDDCLVEEEAYLNAGVKVYPSKTIEAGAHITDSVVWESRGRRAVFGRNGISGLVNVEVTAEDVVRLASAYAATLPKGSVVTAGRDASRAARAFKRALIGALTANAIDVRDLEVLPVPVARFLTATTDAIGGVMLRTTPANQESIDISLFDEDGCDVSATMQRALERTVSRQDFRRAAAGEIGVLSFPPRTVDTYTEEVVARLDLRGVCEAGLKVVVDTAGGAASYVLPSLLGRLDVDSLVVRLGADERITTESAAERAASLRELGDLVASSRADFGVRFDHVGERLCIVDERGHALGDERSQLTMLDLVAAERRQGVVAVPVTTTRVAERLAAAHGVEVCWTGIGSCVLPPGTPGLIYGGDGGGGFVVPEVQPTVDGIAAFVRLVGLFARAGRSLSELDAAIPQAYVRRGSVTVPWTGKGTVMRAVTEAAGDRTIDTTDGVRVVLDDRSWVLVLPDQSEAVAHLWAETGDPDESADLLARWSSVVEEAAR